MTSCIPGRSGDSFVAGLIVEYLTNHKCRCYSPSDLYNSKFIKDKTYCFISVTGKTKANITVAGRAAESGINTTAVTLNKDSKLAQVCKKIVPLDLKRTTFPISSFSIFTANVVTCLQIAGVAVPQKFDTLWYNKGVELSQKFLDSESLLDGPDKMMVFVIPGNNILYPLALYTSLQMAEFFGYTAVAHKLEEFCHSPLFGLKKSHCVWILGSERGSNKKKAEPIGFETFVHRALQ